MRTPSLVLLALAFGAALAQPAPALVIDDFEVGDFTDIDPNTPGAATLAEQSGLSGTDVVGGVRLVSALGTGTGLAAATAILTTSAADDSVALSYAGLDGSSQFLFIYDGIANGAADGINGGLNLDLTAFSAIEVTATAANVTSNARLALWSSTTTQQSVILPLANGVTSFSLASFGALNKADIQQIRLSIDGIELGEAPLVTSIVAVAVPEPSVGLLLALGLVGLGLRRCSC